MFVKQTPSKRAGIAEQARGHVSRTRLASRPQPPRGEARTCPPDGVLEPTSASTGAARIARLRDAIADGTYEVDAWALADEILADER